MYNSVDEVWQEAYSHSVPVSPLLASLFSCRDANHWPVKENVRLQ